MGHLSVDRERRGPRDLQPEVSGPADDGRGRDRPAPALQGERRSRLLARFRFALRAGADRHAPRVGPPPGGRRPPLDAGRGPRRPPGDVRPDDPQAFRAGSGPKGSLLVRGADPRVSGFFAALGHDPAMAPMRDEPLLLPERGSRRGARRNGSGIASWSRRRNPCAGQRCQPDQGATGKTSTTESDHGLASSRYRRPSITSPFCGRPVAR